MPKLGCQHTTHLPVSGHFPMFFDVLDKFDRDRVNVPSVFLHGRGVDAKDVIESLDLARPQELDRQSLQLLLLLL